MRQLMIAAIDANLDTVQEFVGEFLADAGFNSKQITQVHIAVEEIYINIARYAYNPDVGSTTINCHMEPERAVIEFLDSGQPYNPLERPDPDISTPMEERDIGGLGVLMVKKLMDQVSYRYVNGNNLLIIEKNI